MGIDEPLTIKRIFTIAECAPKLSFTFMDEILTINARSYASRHQLQIAEPLGSGKDGIVLVGKRTGMPADVAIKVHRFAEGYLLERRAYERLRNQKVRSVMGFNVPELLGFDDDLRIIEMSIVARPFVLDFAAAYLDFRPEFPKDVWDNWEADKLEQFETRWPTVQKLLDAFEQIGIYLMDVSPANISFLD